MTSHRVRFNRTLFSASLNGGPATEVVDRLAGEDIELVLDVRQNPPQASSVLDGLCAEASMYYVRRDQLRGKELAWAARLALRHRACVLGDPGQQRLDTSAQIARLAGMRVVDIEASPAPIATGDFGPLP
jgi:hypothetical protein